MAGPYFFRVIADLTGQSGQQEMQAGSVDFHAIITFCPAHTTRLCVTHENF